MFCGLFRSLFIVLFFGCCINFWWWGWGCFWFLGLISFGKWVVGVSENGFFNGDKFLMLREVKLGVGILIFLMLLVGNVVLVLFNFIRVFEFIWEW